MIIVEQRGILSSTSCCLAIITTTNSQPVNNTTGPLEGAVPSSMSLPIMSEKSSPERDSTKSSQDGKVSHHENDLENSRIAAINNRSELAQELPIREVMEHHLDEDPKRIARIRRRVDLRLTLMLALLYLWAFIDRANLGNANIAGMSQDLKLNVENRYSIVTMIFFVGYAIVDIPSTILMKKLTATVMIPTVCLSFGVITIGQGFTKHWGQLALCRILLGLFEGFFLPGTIFLLQVRSNFCDRSIRLLSGLQ